MREKKAVGEEENGGKRREVEWKKEKMRKGRPQGHKKLNWREKSRKPKWYKAER